MRTLREMDYYPFYEIIMCRMSFEVIPALSPHRTRDFHLIVLDLSGIQLRYALEPVSGQ